MTQCINTQWDKITVYNKRRLRQHLSDLRTLLEPIYICYCSEHVSEVCYSPWSSDEIPNVTAKFTFEINKRQFLFCGSYNFCLQRTIVHNRKKHVQLVHLFLAMPVRSVHFSNITTVRLAFANTFQMWVEIDETLSVAFVTMCPDHDGLWNVFSAQKCSAGTLDAPW